jgi:hypothetical protein
MNSPYRSVGEPVKLPTITPRWMVREPPLSPVALAAVGKETRHALLQRLAQCGSEELSRLHGVVGDEIVVIYGATEHLPWIDRGHWLGRDRAAPGLYLPTTQKPDVHIELFERMVLRDVDVRAPVAVIRMGESLTLVSLANALTVSRTRVLAALGKTA